MERLEAVRLALQELGEATAEELAAFVQQRHGVRLDPRFVPVVRETLRQQQARDAFYRDRPAVLDGTDAAVAPQTPTAG